jgi:hypothetical protein
MPWIFEVRAQSGASVHSFGVRQDRAEAQQLLAEAQARVAAVGGRNDRYWIEEIDTEGLFEIPSRPTPRERFHTRVRPTSQPRAWQTVQVEILDTAILNTANADAEQVIASYDRNYAMLQTFEPFRQGERNFALISPDYTMSSVIDLDSGQIVASEAPDAAGFCPVGFYVPDWWDRHDGSKLPGGMNWTADDAWPNAGDFGFVWGCLWGDDNSWKVQYLDLSQISEGILRRDERFGYVKLAARPDVPATEFIRVRSHHGVREVEFQIEQTYDLGNGGRTGLDPWA